MLCFYRGDTHKTHLGISLVVCLAVQGMWVWFPVEELRFRLLWSNWVSALRQESPYATIKDFA